MPFKIVRNDITKMHTEAIVNTANDQPTVGTGCDHAIYQAAGYDKLLAYRREQIGAVAEGEAFITPGFDLPAKYIIHAVSPFYIDGKQGEEELLRSCYRKSLALAAENGIHSIAFPLISTGGFGYPKEEGMRIAADEIHAFLLNSDMQIYLVVFDEKTTRMGRNLYPELEAYIDQNYAEEKREEEYGEPYFAEQKSREEADEEIDSSSRRWYLEGQRRRARQESPKTAACPSMPDETGACALPPDAAPKQEKKKKEKPVFLQSVFDNRKEATGQDCWGSESVQKAAVSMPGDLYDAEDAAFEDMQRQLSDRMEHMSDTFPQYLFYLIDKKGLENADVYKRAIVDKKVFSKIKNNPGYHPQKLTALCLCIGAKLNMDESRDLLARAGYALSPCDKMDIIFSFFIEHQIYDMIELDIQLEEHGLPCIIQ